MLTVSKAARSAWLMPLSPAELQAVFAAMLEVADASGACVDLALLDDAGMEALHAESFGCAGPTNILAFPDPFSGRSLGSLALSVDTLERECFLYGQEPQEHCIRLLAHGLAHLLGHDHGPEMNALVERMERAGLTVCRPICR
jgi:probable rRNA maturation factor